VAPRREGIRPGVGSGAPARRRRRGPWASGAARGPRRRPARRLLPDIRRSFGRLDIAVNNAGIGADSAPTGSHSIEGWQRGININLNSVFACLRYEIPRMRESGGGSIVNMASIRGSIGIAHSPAYVAAKHGVVGLTRSAALEYPRHGIGVNSVGPGFIVIHLIERRMDNETQAAIRGLPATGRMGEPQEVADLAPFLCSVQVSFMTGGYDLVHGGYTAQ
jgi:NAD(P)-dependent dehydrogenase (short-subunit alcohol dehydrogenase family)